MGVYTHLCAKCGQHADWICIRCKGCETCCGPEHDSYLNRQAREAQHVIAHSVQEALRRRAQLEETEKPTGDAARQAARSRKADTES